MQFTPITLQTEQVILQPLSEQHLPALLKAGQPPQICHTFIHPDWQRSYINTHAKYLMLKYAFETLGIVRVSFVTHEKNTLSRNAISRLGATFEGIIRKVRLLPNGEYRNSAQFSITNDDWPAIKQALETMMQEWQ